VGVLVLAGVGFTALGFAMAWWIDSTQGYHAIMSVALIPLWMLSGAMFPPSSGGRVLNALMFADPMTYVVSAARRGFHGGPVPAGLAPPGSPLIDVIVVATFAIVAVTAAVALCRRRG
jgi:ABC-2 type transport system permease protein